MSKTKVSTVLTDFFKKGPVTDKSEAVDFAKVNMQAAKLGWIVHPDCCNKSVVRWLNTLTANPNATFYKEWDDVLSKSRFELFVDQMVHYATTYGRMAAGEEPEGNGFVPNDGGPVPRFEDLKVLEPITLDELALKCLEVLKSGIALKDETMKAMCDFYFDTIEWKGDEDARDKISKMLSEIKNREASCYLSSKFNVLPNDEFGMVRCLVYRYTGKMELIKSASAIRDIKASAKVLDRDPAGGPLLRLSEDQVRKLSRIFLRFKPLFLAMKTKKTAAVVNRLRRLAAVNHTPMKVGFWDDIVAKQKPLDELRERLKDLEIWRKLRLMTIARQRMLGCKKPGPGMFIVRNGKTFVREDYAPKYDGNWVSRLYFELEASVEDHLRPKACVVKFPEHYELALPTSEKNFVGPLPFGSYIDLTTNNVIGVYWRNEWGTRDYDLSAVHMDGGKIGWNAAYYGYGARGRDDDENIVYSGDMTNADPEAVELLYMRGSAPDIAVKLNKYWGEHDSRFRLFFANEETCAGNMRGHMVDPNNIKLDVMVPFEGNGEKTVGMIVNGRFYVMDLGSGLSRVSRGGKYVESMVKALKARVSGFVPLREVLIRAGFTVWYPDMRDKDGNPVKPDIDLSSPDKSILVGLFS